MASYDLLKPVVTLSVTSFNTKQIYFLQTYCIYVFCMDLRTKSDYFPIQYLLTGFKKRGGECWLRHCAARWKVLVSIPDGVIGIFYLRYSFGRAMALGSTQLLTEMSTRNISWRVKAAGARAVNLTTLTYKLSRNLGASTSWKFQGQ